ncbi:MAG: TRAP transporter small permease subunit [Parvibaculales bacterium]
MRSLLKISAGIDEFNALILNLVAWLSLGMVLIQIFVVILRYVFGTGSIQIQESIIYMHAMLFMLAAAGTYLADEHVRVDIFYRSMPPRRQAMVNFFGCLFFLLPFCFLIMYSAYDYVALSWRVREGSRETGGIQAIYLLKTVIPVMAGLLMLQGFSQTIKSLDKMLGRGEA